MRSDLSASQPPPQHKSGCTGLMVTAVTNSKHIHGESMVWAEPCTAEDRKQHTPANSQNIEDCPSIKPQKLLFLLESNQPCFFPVEHLKASSPHQAPHTQESSMSIKRGQRSKSRFTLQQNNLLLLKGMDQRMCEKMEQSSDKSQSIPQINLRANLR